MRKDILLTIDNYSAKAQVRIKENGDMVLSLSGHRDSDPWEASYEVNGIKDGDKYSGVDSTDPTTRAEWELIGEDDYKGKWYEDGYEYDTSFSIDEKD